MPIYEYECTACGKHIERIQKVNDTSLVECPECGKPSLHRLVSAPSFHLKGSGWYVTDFRDKQGESKKTEHKTDTSSVKSETATETTSTETKAETKTPETKKTDE